MKTFMFKVLVNNGYTVTPYFTNAILSKNNGALITFRDEDDNSFSCDPTTVTIETNVDPVTHMAAVIPEEAYGGMRNCGDNDDTKS